MLGQDRKSAESTQLQQEVKVSPRVKLLLSQSNSDGRIPFHPYAKWYGAHWVLADLAELGYPPGDDSLIPLREQVYGWLFGQSHLQRIKTIAGRTRRCASQEGNALYYLLALGLADDRTERLAENLLKWQWPDGGWNCDKRPEAVNSSFMESLIPLRGLALYSRLTGHSRARQAVERAAEIFLKRNLFQRQRDGQVISPDFVKLHYPCYWHYDILFGLKVMTEASFSDHPGSRKALELLESKRLPDGGFPAEAKYYRLTTTTMSGRSLVDWGGTSQKRMNEFITADALYVLKAAERL
ncbi:MAG: hypothetical protein U0401_12590 [Anaerolineae bacterium]